jgi:DNA (cytosine-5)-methyltransferase 1
MIIDSFAGGGGASTGIEMALGRSPDVAINHSADALAMHEVNHPDTLHLDSNIWDVSPIEVTKGRPVGLFWASPDCKHFSKAKGGKPMDRNIRDLAWVVVRWAEEAKPDVIILENVEEFRTWGPLCNEGKPIPEMRGLIFEQWMKRLKKAGYRCQWRELRACDYGAPTIRKRFFMIARRDGQPIVWPKRTHGDPKKPADAKLIAAGKLLPWRTAAEIIDWSLPCPSIFDSSAEIMAKHRVRAIRPLADATMRRIARGVMRYVLEAKKPFIVVANHGGAHFRGQGLDEPAHTVAAARDAWGLVMPVVTAAQHGGSSRAVDEPLHTITASPKDQNAVIAAHLTKFQSGSTGSALAEPVPTITANSYIQRPGGAAPIGLVAATMVQTGYGEREGQAPRALDIERPIGTQVGGAAKHAVAAVHLSRFTQNGVGSAADEPVDTVMAGAPKFGVISAFLAQHNNDSRRIGGVNPGQPADRPVATITATGSQQSVIAAHLQNMRGSDRRDAPADGPVPTLSAQGTHAALISGFLTKYYGTGDGAPVDDPMHTDTVKDRFGLVTLDIDGQTYAIADIGMRMLTPRERFRAQGFPDSYIIDRRPNGSPISATVQGSCCGNSVCPPLAQALVAANCAHLVEMKEAAE